MCLEMASLSRMMACGRDLIFHFFVPWNKKILWSSPSAFSFRLFPGCVMTETWIAVVHTFGRVPTAQGKQGKCPKRIPCQGKHREFEKVAKTQGILFAQVVFSMILKVKDIS